MTDADLKRFMFDYQLDRHCSKTCMFDSFMRGGLITS